MIASLLISARTLPNAKPGQLQVFSGQADQTLQWLASRLRALGLISEGVPIAKNERSHVDVIVFAQRYRLQSVSRDCTERSATIKLKKRSALIDRLLGRDGFDADDAFFRVLQDLLEREAAVERVDVDWSSRL